MDRYKEPYTVFRTGDSPYFKYRLGSDPKRRKRSTGKTNERDARRWVEEEILGMRSSKSAGTPKAPPLSSWALDAWDKHVRQSQVGLAGKKQKKKPITARYAEQRRRQIETYILTDPIAQRPMDTISAENLNDFAERLLSTKLKGKDSTAALVIQMMHWLFRYAHRVAQIIPANVADDANNYHPETQAREPYSETELSKLFPANPWKTGSFSPWKGPEDYTAFLIAACTGMRKGEVLGLRWEDYRGERDAEHFVVSRQIKDKSKEPTPLKNGKPRTVILFDWLLWKNRRGLRALEELRKRAAVASSVVGLDGKPEPTGYLFHDPTGEPRRGTWWQKHLRDGLKTSGIDRDRGQGKMKADAHSLRHTLASFLRAAGIPDSTIREHCGWASESIQAVYSHTGIDQIKLMRKNAVRKNAVNDAAGNENPF